MFVRAITFENDSKQTGDPLVTSGRRYCYHASLLVGWTRLVGSFVLSGQGQSSRSNPPY